MKMRKVLLIVGLILGALPAYAQSLMDDASLDLNATYYGRARSTEDGGAEIHVNALGLGLDFASGYYNSLIGFDLGANANLGAGNGQSEVLDYDEDEDEDSSIVSLRTAALKLQSGNFHLAGGYLPMDVGTIGTSGGIYNHSYRGLMLDYTFSGFTIAYGIADQFHKEWREGFYDMAGGSDGVDYIHSIGLRYENDNGAYLAFGIGQGKDYRENIQLTAAHALTAGERTVTPKIYALGGKYDDSVGVGDDKEYHISGSILCEGEILSGGIAYSYTWAPNSEEMSFRLADYGYSDSNNDIQAYGQLDDFVWHNEKAVKLWIDYALDGILPLPGFSIGANGNYGMGVGDGHDGTAWEIDYYIAYEAPEESFLAGLNAGIYMGNLRTDADFRNYSGIQDRDDIKLIIGYTYKML